jgi:hypothetical protein
MFGAYFRIGQKRSVRCLHIVVIGLLTAMFTIKEDEITFPT